MKVFAHLRGQYYIIVYPTNIISRVWHPESYGSTLRIDRCAIYVEKSPFKSYKETIKELKNNNNGLCGVPNSYALYTLFEQNKREPITAP